MAKKEQPTANRNYKDTVFRMLFSDRKNLLSLYNAVSGSHYDDPEKLEIITLPRFSISDTSLYHENT